MVILDSVKKGKCGLQPRADKIASYARFIESAWQERPYAFDIVTQGEEFV